MYKTLKSGNNVAIICILIAFLSFILSGCSAETSTESQPVTVQESPEEDQNISASEDTVSVQSFRVLSVDEAYEIYSSGKDCLFIDVRNEGEFKISHIKGAILIPVKEIEANLDKIPKDKIIVVYCNGKGCNKSSTAAGILVQDGFKQVYSVGGLGIYEWINKGYPVEYPAKT